MQSDQWPWQRFARLLHPHGKPFQPIQFLVTISQFSFWSQFTRCFSLPLTPVFSPTSEASLPSLCYQLCTPSAPCLLSESIFKLSYLVAAATLWLQIYWTFHFWLQPYFTYRYYSLASDIYELSCLSLAKISAIIVLLQIYLSCHVYLLPKYQLLQSCFWCI